MTSLSNPMSALSVSNPTPPQTSVWQWYDDSWNNYDDAIAKKLDACVLDGTLVADFNANGNGYEVDLNEMVQTNLMSNFRRRVRYLSGSLSGKWQWDDNGDWKDYDATGSAAIQQALENNTDYRFTYGQYEYVVNTDEMTQTNTSTQYPRRIRQVMIPPAAASAAPAEPIEPVDPTCDICYERKKNTAFIPCGHLACNICTARVMATSGWCPFCRKPIERRLHITLT